MHLIADGTDRQESNAEIDKKEVTETPDSLGRERGV
jgi:hypothetical protein